MKKRKILAMILAAIMTCSMSLTALAAEAGDADAATTPKGSGATYDSTGLATVTGDGTTFNSENDDDAITKETDTTGTDINVWAKVIDGSSPVYKIDIAWGAMKFQFESGEGQWNTTSHTYEGGGTGNALWTVTGYLDGTNNQVTVTNHSNKAVSAEFAYAMELTDGKSQFNDSPNDTASVKGNFFADNDKAKAAALVLNDTSTVSNTFTEKLKLHTADKYYATQDAKDAGEGSLTAVFSDENKVTTGREKSVFFAFSGKPDANKGSVLDSFTKVGVITVTVAPLTDGELTDFEF